MSLQEFFILRNLHTVKKIDDIEYTANRKMGA